MNRYSIIHDEDIVRSFMRDVMPELRGRTQAYFLSLSARKKYFTAEQRRVYALSGSEMFGRKLVTSKAGMVKALQEFELPEGSYTVRKDSDRALPVDPHVLTAYLNLHPADTVEAWSKANQRVTESLLRAAQGSGIDVHFVPPMSTFMTECQKARAFKYFVDIDFDVPAYSTAERIELAHQVYEQMSLDKKAWSGENSARLQSVTVYTSSGFHILLKTASVDFPFMRSVQIIEQLVRRDMIRDSISESDWEIVLNKNQMIPVPGTYQPVKGGDKYPVTFEISHWDNGGEQK